MQQIYRQDSFIELSDGIKLFCTMWIPVNNDQKYPCILEYLPYWASVWTKKRDEQRHSLFAQKGYVSLRVDFRGAGDSEGVYYDEYLKQEQDDALEILEWIEKQSWSNGKVGMYGKSWGGFNGLQVAARQPPQLNAVISLYSTDDRFNDDIHYKGGCLLNVDNASWAGVMTGWNARCPNPANQENYLQIWKNRLEKQNNNWVDLWLEHQEYNDYWKHGSVKEDYSQIKCPTFLIGGWIDGYTNAVFRLMEKLSCQKKALVGPWSHEWPDIAIPGPQIRYVQECLRFFDQHLKNIETGIKDEPDFRIYVRLPVIPSPQVLSWPGFFVSALSNFNIIYHVNQQNILVIEQTDDHKQITLKQNFKVGNNSGAWLSFGYPDLPLDQNGDDAYSNCFETMPLIEETIIIGMPKLTLQYDIENKQHSTQIIARLCIIDQQGNSLFMSKSIQKVNGMDNLITMEFDATAYEIPPGYQIRLAISQNYWPLIWPSAKQSKIILKKISLNLPVLIKYDKQESINSSMQLFQSPLINDPPHFKILRQATYNRKLIIDQALNSLELLVKYDDGCWIYQDKNILYDEWSEESYQILENDPLSNTVKIKREIYMEMPDKLQQIIKTKVIVELSQWCDESQYYTQTILTVFKDGVQFYGNKYEKSHKRLF